MTPAPDLRDYNEVSERLIQLRQKYPDASLSSEVILWPTKELPFLAVKATCHRSRRDENPGVGLAWEPVPGRTQFTRDSELQNAETSAWGRAIVAALAADTRKGIASADEIRARQTPDPSPPQRRSGQAGPEGSSKFPSGSAPSSGGGTSIRGGASPEGEGTEPAPAGEGGNGSVPDLLARAVELYGSEARLLRASRMLHDFTTVESIDRATLEGMIARKAPA